ncbi:MAG: hypothetical protein G01um10148_718 [Parcubacteria group bacterium Gr01-1014_8]|nr:MAG: hypothetical protein G01um10148_718 [Parcubacteria group bacterium Gr01-1014_8]
MHGMWKARSAKLIVAASLSVLFVAGLIFFYRTALAHALWEGIHLESARMLAPNDPKLLYEMGSYFLNTRDDAYSIKKAETYLKKAAFIMPHFPYVHHELARIYFLRSDFATALAHITIEISEHGDAQANSYYVRGLIEGFMTDYEAAARDYELYLSREPSNWAGLNDYAWVLLKSNCPRDARAATEHGLQLFPENPWLLSSHSIALFELGEKEAALKKARDAVKAAMAITEKDWLTAYPGNDPRIAPEGVYALQDSLRENMRSIQTGSIMDVSKTDVVSRAMCGRRL